ncbi:MAG: hypothetical protein ACRCVW_00450 [Brevinema sp.]
MKYHLLLIILLFGACAEDSRELTRPNIERWIKKDKLHKYIDETYFVDALKELLTILTEEERSIYADYIARKEQELRFPRPTPMTLEYLDSITNQSVYSLAIEHTNELDTSVTNNLINDRLVLIESFHISTSFNNESEINVEKFEKFFTNIQPESECQLLYKKIFYNAVYHDPIENRYYFGETLYTNNIDYQLSNTNNISLGTPESIIYITNLSPSERLYFDLNSNILFIRKISRIIDPFVNEIYFKGTPYNPQYYSISSSGNTNDFLIREFTYGIPAISLVDTSILEVIWGPEGCFYNSNND